MLLGRALATMAFWAYEGFTEGDRTRVELITACPEASEHRKQSVFVEDKRNTHTAPLVLR